MRLMDRLFTRRRHFPKFADLPEGVSRRLAGACLELTDAEDQVAAQLGLISPPRLMLVDEETAVILTADERQRLAVSAAKVRDRP